MDSAIREYQTAARDFPQDELQQQALSSVLLRAKRVNEAIVAGRRAVQLAPQSAGAHRCLGVALLMAGPSDEAVSELQRAVDLAPRQAWTHLLLAEALIRTKRLEQAGTVIDRALSIEPDNPAIFEEVARLYSTGRQFRGAAEAARRGLRLDPNRRSLQRRMAWMLATSPDDGVRDGNMALRMAETLAAAPGGRDCWTLVTLGAALGEVGRFEEARTVLAGAIAPCKADDGLSAACRLMDTLFSSHERFADLQALGGR